MNIRFAPNTLYYGDCLDILRDFPSDCVDLICLDPPFNSNAKYSTIFRNSGLNINAQIKAFDDMWLWDPKSAERVRDIKNAIANPASKVIAGFEQFIPQSPMLSYTSYMAQRLFAMHRVLKDTGSIYLHCDPTASHYLKLVLDAVFGEKNFGNEIIWHYKRWPSGNQHFQRMHDVILRYRASENATFNVQFQPYST
jgi:site-specific DNA-methyltransferase (adenine-specific)